MTTLRIQIEIDAEITPDLYAVLLPLKRVKRTEKLRALAAESLALKKLQMLAAQGLVPVHVSGLHEGIVKDSVSQHVVHQGAAGEGRQPGGAGSAVNTGLSQPPAAPQVDQPRQMSRGRAAAAKMSQSLLRG